MYTCALNISQEEKLELSSGSEQLAEFLKEADVLLHEAISNEEKCGTVLIELRQKVKEYPNHEGTSIYTCYHFKIET